MRKYCSQVRVPAGLKAKGIEGATTNLPEGARIRIPPKRFLDAFGPELQAAIKDLRARKA